MLWFGYVGERELMHKRIAQTGGFIALGVMLFIIYYFFLRNTRNFATIFLFVFFSVVWCMYGIAAEFPDRTKNLMYNVLDIISKVFIGLGLWCYYGGIFNI